MAFDLVRPCLLAWFVCTLNFVAAAEAPERTKEIDWIRARELFQRSERGGALNEEEKSYLQRARALREAARPGSGGAAGSSGDSGQMLERAETGMVSLSDLVEPYKGEPGGLYGGRRNEPPAPLDQAARAAMRKIRPLDTKGNPSANGKIVLLSIGMSNTTMEFSRFTGLEDSARAAAVLLIDGAQGGQTADRIADENAPFWRVIDERLERNGVGAAQVQVVWLKSAIAGPREPYPAEMLKLKSNLALDVAIARKRYPNLQLVFLSSRIYAGYANGGLNPEPHAYESGFAVRGLIAEQDFNHSPVLLWGPYLWADGTKGRKAGDLVWLREDFGSDGTHPSATGRDKVANQLLKFFHESPYSRDWYLRH